MDDWKFPGNHSGPADDDLLFLSRRTALDGSLHTQNSWAEAAVEPRKSVSVRLSEDLPQVGRAFLQGLFRSALLTPSAGARFLAEHEERLPKYTTPEALSEDLVHAGLLTPYQVHRFMEGTTYGMVLGNHRVLDRLDRGGMGVVFLAEHMFMKRRVAVKVMAVDEECPPDAVERFYSEMRILAELRHPNIVMAFDAGKLASPMPDLPDLLYLVMELVPGGNLQHYGITNGPAPIAKACEWISQAACGVQAAHDHHVVHRDIKPSNLLLDQDNHVKVVDFGLVRQFSSRLTGPHTVLGTVQFMSPEQSQDPSRVGTATDIYGLGATLFWLLTAEGPYPHTRSIREGIKTLQQSPPRRLRSLRPDVPEELDHLVARMLDRDPSRRPALPLTVMKALQPFCALPGA